MYTTAVPVDGRASATIANAASRAKCRLLLPGERTLRKQCMYPPSCQLTSRGTEVASRIRCLSAARSYHTHRRNANGRRPASRLRFSTRRQFDIELPIDFPGPGAGRGRYAHASSDRREGVVCVSKAFVLYDEEPPADEYMRHVELCCAVPGAAAFRHGRVFGSPFGQPEYQYYAEWEFADMDAFKAAARTPEFAASGKH